MSKLATFSMLAFLAVQTSVNAQEKPRNYNLSQPVTVSIQDALATGSTHMKMHALNMMLTGKVTTEIDDSFLKPLTICAADEVTPIRALTAKALGQFFVTGKEYPPAKVLQLLQKLASDDSKDVRFNAIYHGLTQIKNKTPELAERLIDYAANNRDEILFDRILVSLSAYQSQAIEILNTKLNGENGIVYYEIYEEFTGKQPPNADKFADMPSSRPKLFIIKTTLSNADTAAAKLEDLLAAAGLQNPLIDSSDQSGQVIMMLTTYITKDISTAHQVLKDAAEYSIVQEFWMTPEIEVQLESLK